MLPKSPEAQWPPRSPHEALLSTPGGRARLRRMAERQTSPSPLRSRTPGSRRLFDDDEDGRMDPGDEEDDDEETLQLQLQEIQAKLRLKKLQASKAHRASSPTKTPGGATARSSTAMSDRFAGAGSMAGATTAASLRARSPQKTAVEVPASPVRRAQSAASGTILDQVMQKSPRRVLLGIDKGLRGQDVSLKRAPSSLRRKPNSTLGTLQTGAGQGQDTPVAARPLSFNERLAAARTQEAAKQDKADRIQKLRTSAFSVGRAEMEDYKAKAVDLPVNPLADKPQQYSRDDILGAGAGSVRSRTSQSQGQFLHRSRTAPDLRAQSNEDAAASVPMAPSSEQQEVQAEDGGDGGGESFEPYSSFHLSKRVLPHAVVARAVSGKTTYSLKDLLRLVKAPDFELPEVETDVVVFAIVASKSDPRAHKQHGGATAAINGSSNEGKNNLDRGKYMVITLVDLKFEVDLFLFKTGFDRFWKLPTGTVVAILNPGVMPPPRSRQHTGRFGLVINSDEDTILEIGTSRDLGYCKSIRRDGQLCNSWVNAKRTEFCDFHMNEAVRKMRGSRNELNGAAGFGDKKGRSKYNKYPKPGKKVESVTMGYDPSAQSQWYVAGATGSASSLLDRDDGGYADKVERKEGIKRRLVAKERETDIARKLGEMGSGAGRDYMQLTAQGRAAAAAAEAEKRKNKNASSSTKPGTSATTASLSSASSLSTARSATLSSASSAATSLASPAATGTIAEQAAASRASLLASVTSRRSGGGLYNSSGIPSSASQPVLGDHGQLAASPVIHLSPVKRKRPQSSQSGTLTSRDGDTLRAANSQRQTGGLGWGTNLTAKLGRMKEGEKLVPSSLATTSSLRSVVRDSSSLSRAQATTPTPSERSPVRKKTRFFLGDKGIREAGRESLGTTVPDAGTPGSSNRRGKIEFEFALEDDDLMII